MFGICTCAMEQCETLDRRWELDAGGRAPGRVAIGCARVNPDTVRPNGQASIQVRSDADPHIRRPCHRANTGMCALASMSAIRLRCRSLDSANRLLYDARRPKPQSGWGEAMRSSPTFPLRIHPWHWREGKGEGEGDGEALVRERSSYVHSALS